jgi:glycosyltransferase involved in cell wall biosynthesis
MLVYGTAKDNPRLTNEGRSLVEAGYHVDVLAILREGFPAQPVRAEAYGIHITHVPVVPDLRPGTLARGLLAWMKGDTGEKTTELVRGRSKLRTLMNLLAFNLWALRLGGRFRPDIVHAHEPATLVAGWLIARRYRVPLIFDEYEPIAFTPRTPVISLFWRIELLLSQRASATIIAHESLRQQFELMGARIITTIPNYKRLQDYDGVTIEQVADLRRHLGLATDDVVIVYLGLLWTHREITPLLAAIGRSPDIKLVIAGRGDLESEVREQSLLHDNIIWLGWLPLHEVPLYNRMADAIYGAFADEPPFRYVEPNKLYESFAAGRPMIYRSRMGDTSRILLEAGSGILLEDITPEALEASFDVLRDSDAMMMLKDNAYRARSHHNWDTAEERLLALYRRLLPCNVMNESASEYS